MRAFVQWHLVVLAGLVAYPAVMIVVATTNGPGISIDSVSYASAATSFAESGHLLTYDGSALTLFPPGFPAVLGALMAVGASLSTATVVVNVVAVGVTVVATYFLARQVLLGAGWSLVATAVVSVLAATVRVGSYLWTEALFTALVTVALALLAWAVRNRQAPWWLVVASGVLIALATTVRYVGVVAVPIVMVAIAWAARNSRVIKTLVAGAVGVAGLVVVALRNVLIGASAFGDRYPGSLTFDGAFSSLVLQWGDYVAPSRTTSLTVIVGSIVGLAILLGIWLVIVHRNAAGIVIGLFVGAYWIAILVSQVGTRLDVVTERFGAPVLASSVVLFLVAIRSVLAIASDQLAALLGISRQRVRRGLSVVLGVVGVVVLGLSMVHAVEFVADGNRQGISLASTTAADRAIVQAVALLPTDSVVASNDPWQVWWSRGGVVLDFPPSRAEWPSERVESDLAALIGAASDGERVFVVIDEGARASIDLSELESAGLPVQLLDDADGVVVAEVTSG